MATVQDQVGQQPGGPRDIQLPPPTGTVLEGVRGKVFMDRYSLKDESGQAVEQTRRRCGGGWRGPSRGRATPEARATGRSASTRSSRLQVRARRPHPLRRRHRPPGHLLQLLRHPQPGRQPGRHPRQPQDHDRDHGPRRRRRHQPLHAAPGRLHQDVNGTASGPCSWAELYSVATGDVIQQGGSRRGALMLMLNDDHPDIEEFITAKKDLSRINHANLSVCVSDPFMEAVKADAEWRPHMGRRGAQDPPRPPHLEHDLRERLGRGEPGLVFIDRYNRNQHLVLREHHLREPLRRAGAPGVGRLQPRRAEPLRLRRRGRRDTPAVRLRRAGRRVARLDALPRQRRRRQPVLLRGERQGPARHAAHRAGHDGPGRRPDQAARPVRLGRERAGDRAHLPHHPRRGLRCLGRPRGGEGAVPHVRPREVPPGALHQAPAGRRSRRRSPRTGSATPCCSPRPPPARPPCWPASPPGSSRSSTSPWCAATAPASTSSTTPCCRRGRTPTPRPRRAPGLVRLRQRPHPRGARAGAGQGAAVHRLLDLQDGERPQRPHRRAGAGAVHQGLRLRLQGRHLLPRRLPRGRPLAHREQGAGAGSAAPEGRRGEVRLRRRTRHAAPEAVQLGLSLAGTPEPGQHLKPRPRAAEGITYRMPTPWGRCSPPSPATAGGSPSRSSSRWGRPGRIRPR